VKETEQFYPENQAEWRKWLQENHLDKQAVWLQQHAKKSEKPSINWSDAVDEALCFGWIDSKKVKLDHETTLQFFSKRKPKSTWSKINKEKIERLISEGKMTPAGLAIIEIAKQNGSWNILDEVEALTLPNDLEQALLAHESAMTFYEGLSKSVKKMMLYWLVSAKRAETRQKRIDEIATLAAKGQKPKHM
jgi:uncharacterized protein YdeI (YjbR/CyaY-like superfamily)